MSENKTTTINTLVQGCLQTAIPIAPIGAIYRETTTSIANKVVDMLNNTFGIIEADHVFMYPVSDKTGRIVDFNMVIYFNCANNRGGNYTIRRMNGKANNYNGGRLDLTGLAGAQMGNGGFEMTPDFKKRIASIACLDDNNNIVVKPDPNHNMVAVIQCDFFKVIALCLGISPDDNYDFSILDCQPFRNNADSLDFTLIFTKEIRTENRRRGKDGINYEYSDRRNMKNRQ